MSTDGIIATEALRLWSQKGYQAVGIQEICLDSGVTKPTLYHWFGSKLGLLNRILTAGFSPLWEELETKGSYRGDVRQALYGWMEAWMTYTRLHPQFMRLLLSLGTAPPDSEEYLAGQTGQNRIFHHLREVFSSAALDHGNMRGRETSYALSFLGMMQSHSASVLNGKLEWTEGKAGDLLHYFMHGIFS